MAASTNRGWDTVSTRRRTKDVTMEQTTTREERLEVMIRVKRGEKPMKTLLKLKELNKYETDQRCQSTRGR